MLIIKIPPKSAGAPLSQMSLTGQQYYPSCPLKGNGRNGDRGSGDLLSNSRHYPHRSGVGCCGLHGTPGGGDSGSPNDPYGDGLDSLFTSEFGR